MAVVQDPKADTEERLAGLEVLRCMLCFDDKGATTRRLGCATLLRSVLENKNGSAVVGLTYDMSTMLLATQVTAHMLERNHAPGYELQLLRLPNACKQRKCR